MAYKPIIALLVTASLYGDGAKDFVRQSLGDEYHIKAYKSSDYIDAGSTANVHFVTRKGEPIAVLKHYAKSPNEEKLYHDERHAYEALATQPENLNAPQLFVAGEDEEGFYLIMDIAKGESMNRLMQEVQRGRLSKDELYIAIEESSRLLRNFHNYSARHNLHKNFSRLHSTGRIILKGLDNLNPSEFDVSKLHQVHDQLLSRFMNSNAAIGQVHGDMHPGNAFYDPKTNTVTMIDFSSLNHPARSNQGEYIARDAMKYLITLQIAATKYGFSDDELEKIEGAFFNGYGRDKLKKAEMDYFKFYYAIDMIDAYGKQEKSLYAYCKNVLNNQEIA